MKGYIYRLYGGADPSKGWIFNDPIFSKKRSSLGACVPNVRRSVGLGDWVFCISGRVDGLQPFVVGGFKVDEKITALQAFRKYPEFRLSTAENGQVIGNIIVDGRGQHHPLDDHDKFEMRVQNYLVGTESLQVRADNVERARAETVPALARIFEKPANRSFDIVPRWRRLNEVQVDEMRDWLRSLA